ncbi:MAG: DNA primase [Bacteroidales bacterium]|nr:DNA primase [Bacteroidales bacterium]
MIPKDTVDLILNTARIEDIVGDFVTLKRRGANYVACCPFHQEKTPSFYVSPSKGIYKCFGCGKSGSAVGFLMEHEHSSYVEALRYIAKRYNIEVVEEEESPEELASRQRSESLLLVSEFAQKFFAEQLKAGEGKDVGLAYYHSRRLEDETIAKFGLGWAPSGKDDLLQAARAAGYKDEYLIDAGLVVQREDGSLTDKFRERVMFPIQSVSGRTIAFSGRTLKADNPAKYVNSPDTEIYRKSNILFGIYYAKQDISRQNECIIVEGNIDYVMLQQLGIHNVVAPCGTALTVQQVRLIRKFTDNILLMNDGDNAGIHASLKDIDLILYEGLNVRVVLLPDGEDPDSFSKGRSLEEVQRYIEDNAKDFLDFKSDILLGEAAGNPLKKANFVNDIADTIARIPDAVKRSVYVNAAAEKFDVAPEVIFTRVKRTRDKLLEDEQREKERENRNAADGQSPSGAFSRTGSQSDAEEGAFALSADKYIPEVKTMAAVEEDILSFLLQYGSEELHFETDSPYYDPETVDTVADFISATIESTRQPLANEGYRRVYDAYLELYYEGRPQDEIIRTLLDSPDRVLAEIVGDFSTRKYQLSVKRLESSLTNEQSWLVNYVPRAMLTLAERRIQWRLDTIRRSMNAVPAEEQLAMMKEMTTLQKRQKNLKEALKKED